MPEVCSVELAIVRDSQNSLIHMFASTSEHLLCWTWFGFYGPAVNLFTYDISQVRQRVDKIQTTLKL